VQCSERFLASSVHIHVRPSVAAFYSLPTTPSLHHLLSTERMGIVVANIVTMTCSPGKRNEVLAHLAKVVAYIQQHHSDVYTLKVRYTMHYIALHCTGLHFNSAPLISSESAHTFRFIDPA
jgi:hypothetical protein